MLVGRDLNVHYLSRAYPRSQLIAAGLVSTFDSLVQPANGGAQPISHNTYDLNSSAHRLLIGTFQTVG